MIRGSTKELATEQSFAVWCDGLAQRLDSIYRVLSHVNVEHLFRLRQEQLASRAAADAAAKDGFSGEPLAGIGGDIWRRLWEAARDYSTSTAYPEQDFPVLEPSAAGDPPYCVLCQQELTEDGQSRMARFEAFVSGALAADAVKAEQATNTALKPIRELLVGLDTNSEAQLSVLDARDPKLATEVRAWLDTAAAHHAAVIAGLESGVSTLSSSLVRPPDGQLGVVAEGAKLHAQQLAAASIEKDREGFENERRSLQDKKLLADNIVRLQKRRDLLSVSSLDRERSRAVASRLATEAAARQVIVFTHDLIFCNELCNAASDQDNEPLVLHVFKRGDTTGHIDPGGLPWKGQKVVKRLNVLRNDFASTKTLYAQSPSEYERRTKDLYGRLRDAYERAVEECIFKSIVTRGSDEIRTQELRYVHLSDAVAERFHEGMTKANTHSHDNPESETVPVPEPDEVEQDLHELKELVVQIVAEQNATEARRPKMKKRA